MIRQRRASTLSRLLDIARQRLLPPAPQRLLAPSYAAMATPPGFDPPPYPGSREGAGSHGGNGGPQQDRRWNNPFPGSRPSSGSRMGEEASFRSPNPYRMHRDPTQGKVAGVCAGLADYFNIDVTLVRVITVISLFVAAPLTLAAYLALAVILKPAPRGLYHSGEEEAFWRSVNSRPDQTLTALHARLRGLDQQIVAMEGFIASREFDLRRQFKDLEK